jgi:hypothetical protein
MIGSKDPTLVHAGPIEELGVPEALSAGERLPAARGRARYSSMVGDAEEAELLNQLATSTAQMPFAQFRVVAARRRAFRPTRRRSPAARAAFWSTDPRGKKKKKPRESASQR